MFDEHKEIYLFFADLRPNSTLQATWIQHVSQVATVAAIYDQPSRPTKSFIGYYRTDIQATDSSNSINFT